MSDQLDKILAEHMPIDKNHARDAKNIKEDIEAYIAERERVAREQEVGIVKKQVLPGIPVAHGRQWARELLDKRLKELCGHQMTTDDFHMEYCASCGEYKIDGK